MDRRELPFDARPVGALALEGDRLLARYLRSVPLLWILGLNNLVAAGLMLSLGWRRWPTDARTNLVAFAWAAVSAAQAASVFYNWSAAALPLSRLPGLLMSNTTLGWLFLGICLAAGRAWSMASPVAVRGMMVLALHVVLVGTLAYAVAFLSHRPAFEVETPLRLVLGQSHGADFYTVATFYQIAEGSFGLVRLVLFFPWSTCLSLAGVCLVLIATCEQDLRWRLTGIAGGLFAIVFSFSRVGVVALPAALAACFVLRARAAWVAAALAAAAFAALLLVVADIGILDGIAQLVTALHDSRAGSSQGRELVYDASWRAFLASPVFGWGWVGPSVIPEEVLPIGSHSTLYGVLYTGGASTFACLVLAIGLTAAAVLRQALRRRDAPSAAAAGALGAIVVFSYGEALYSFVIPLVFVFMFIGGALGGPPRPTEPPR